MVKEIIVKERQIVEGKWVSEEKKLNDDGDDALEFSQFILVSPDGEKRVKMSLDNDGVIKLNDGTKDYRMLVTGINSQSGDVVFNNTKSVRVNFPTRFSNWPSINLTLADQNNTPPYRIWPGKTGFTIRFKQRFTGTVAWTAMEA